MPTQSFFRWCCRSAGLLLAAVLTAPLPAQANCRITYDTDAAQVEEVLSIYKARYDFKNYDEVCEKLEKANAKVVIFGNYSVPYRESIGWVQVVVADKDNDALLIHRFGSNSVYANTDNSSRKAREMLWMALNLALDRWPNNGVLSEALEELKEARAALDARVVVEARKAARKLAREDD